MNTPTLFDQDIVHQYENNAVSQQILDENRDHYKGQVKLIYDHLMKGGRINSQNNRIWNGSRYSIILDVRARIRDISRVVGASVSSVNIVGGHGLKDWYMSEADKAINKINHGEILK